MAPASAGRLCLQGVAITICLVLWAGLARAADPPAGTLCRPAIDAAENAMVIPSGLLGAIGRVESGVMDPATDRLVSWPWTIDVEGVGRMFASKQEAVTAVAALQAAGVHSIDVGCMQVNLQQHPAAFASLEQAFDPAANADYAARFLRRLFAATSSWPAAAAAYHSATPSLGAAYRSRVLAAWGVAPPPASRPGPIGPFAPASTVYAAFAPATEVYAAFPAKAAVFGAFARPAAAAAPVQGVASRPGAASRMLASVARSPSASR